MPNEKKCPYCAETIKADAIVCRYCGRDLDVEQVKALSGRAPSRNEPSKWAAFGFILLMFEIIYIGALVLGAITASSEETFTNAIITWVIGSRIVLAALGTKGRTGAVTFLSFLGTLIISLIPFLSWLVIYWSGKSLARDFRSLSLGALFTLDGLVLVGGFIFLVGIGDLAPLLQSSPALSNSGGFASNNGSVVFSSPTPRRIPTHTASVDYSGLSSGGENSPPNIASGAPSGCLSWNSVSLSNVGQEVCATGTVWGAYDSGEAFFVTFSQDSSAFYVLSYDWFFPDVKPGSCVVARGVVKKLGRAPVILIEYQDHLYLCN